MRWSLTLVGWLLGTRHCARQPHSWPVSAAAGSPPFPSSERTLAQQWWCSFPPSCSRSWLSFPSLPSAWYVVTSRATGWCWEGPWSVTTLLPSYRKTQWSSKGLTLEWLDGLCSQSQGTGRREDWLFQWLTSGSHVFSGWAASSPWLTLPCAPPPTGP